MKDIQKIKEFFSKPLEESLTGGYPHTKSSGENFEKITITEPIDDATKDKMIKNFRDKGWDAKPNNGGGITAIKKAMMEAKKETEGVWNKKAIEDFFTFLETIGIKVTYLKFTNTKGTNGEVDMKINRDKYLANFHVNYSNNTYYLVLIRTIDSDLASEDLDIFLQKKKAGRKVKYDSFSTGNAAIISFKEEEETAVDMAKNQLDALGVKYEMSGNKFKPFEAIYRPNNKSNSFYEEFNRIVYEFNLGSAVKQSKSMDEAKFMSGMLSGKDFINAKLKNYPKAVAKINQLINMIGEDKFTIEMAEWIFDFFNNAHFESPVNEASKEEDVVDTITMDVPLFIRMLEYSREDAAEDMDLHDVTEKAISLGKERGILQMDDYDEIIGTTEELKEGMGNEIGDKVYFKNEIGEKYPPFKGYYGVIEDTTPASNYNMMATYQVVVYDENDNEIRTIKTDFTNLTSKAVNEAVNLKASKLSSAEYQQAKKLKDFKSSDWKWNADEDLYTKVVKEATDYMKRRKSEDDYATKKPKQPAYTGKTDYQKGREAEKKLAETIFSKLKEAKSTPCWKGYEQKGMKKKDGRQVPNCVPKN